jgi:Tripartite tricarboxylate transporter TctB family
MKVQSQKDLFAGLMFMVTGTGFAWRASHYTVGSGARMGPGYFPLILGVMLAVIGVAVAVKSFLSGNPQSDKVGKIAWRPLVFIILANLVFGAAIGGLPSMGLPPMGLIVGIFLLTFIASNAGSEFNFKEVGILACILAVISYVAFVVLLKLQFPVWPSFLFA